MRFRAFPNNFDLIFRYNLVDLSIWIDLMPFLAIEKIFEAQRQKRAFFRAY